MKNSISHKVIKALSIFTGVQAIAMVCSIVRTKLVSIWIGTLGVGLFATYNAALEFMATCTQLNIRESAVRDLSTSTSGTVGRISAAVRWWSRRLGVAGGLLIAALSPLLSIVSFGDTDHWWAFAALSAAMIAMAANNGEQAIMQGTGQLKALAKASVWGAVGGTLISLPLFYYLRERSIVLSIIVYALCIMAASLILNRQRSSKCSRKENVSTGKSFLKLGLYLTIPTIATTAASYIFISYLNSAYSESTTGIYQAGYTLLIRYTSIVFTAMSMEYFPRISRTAMRKRTTSLLVSHELTLILLALIPLMIVMVGADELALRLLYTEDFLAAQPLITLGSLGIIFRGMACCMAFVIIARGDGRTYLWVEIASAAIGLGLNIVCFHFYSFAGLGVSYTIWYLVYTLMVWGVYRRYGMRIEKGAAATAAWAVTAVICAVLLKGIGWWASLLMLIPAGAVTWKAYGSMHKSRKKLPPMAEGIDCACKE